MSDNITKDYYIKVRYEGDPVPDKAGNVERNIARGISNAFTGWLNFRVVPEPMEWIDAFENPPEQRAQVNFIIEAPGSYLDGEVVGGTYKEYVRGEHVFATPGFSFNARWWMPIPNIPKPNK